jgi:adenine deaminase
MGDKTGTLEKGKLADILIVDGDPLNNLSVQEDPDAVIQKGRIVSKNGRITSSAVSTGSHGKSRPEVGSGWSSAPSIHPGATKLQQRGQYHPRNGPGCPDGNHQASYEPQASQRPFLAGGK